MMVIKYKKKYLKKLKTKFSNYQEIKKVEKFQSKLQQVTTQN